MVEELANRDSLAVRDEPRQVPLDAVTQAKLALADQLQDERGDIGLGLASDSEAVAWSHRGLIADIAEPTRNADRALPVTNHQDGARNTGSDEPIDALLETSRLSTYGGFRLANPSSGAEHDRHQAPKHPPPPARCLCAALAVRTGGEFWSSIFS